MTFRLAIALLLIATSAYSTGANAQKVYRCGSSYSQTPCADGAAIDVKDDRSAAQQAQSQAMAKKEQNAANALEKDRR